MAKNFKYLSYMTLIHLRYSLFFSNDEIQTGPLVADMRQASALLRLAQLTVNGKGKVLQVEQVKMLRFHKDEE